MKNHPLICSRAIQAAHAVKSKTFCCLAVASLLLFGSLPAHAGQIQPAEVESALLVTAVNSGDYTTALEILRAHGITNGTLTAMAARLGRPTQRVALNEPFLKGWEPTKFHKASGEIQRRIAQASAVGYPRVLWAVESAAPNAMELLEAQQQQSIVPPIGAMDVRLPETNVIGFFLWYDRFAEQLHSVALNLSYVNNLESRNQAQAYALLNALFQLVKSRKPDTFVWLAVRPTGDDTDLQWLETMRFGYDGLLVVGDLVDFLSDFEGTRERYVKCVGANVPMVVGEFAGFNYALRRAAKIGGGHGRDGMENLPAVDRRKARALEQATYAGVGKVVAPQLPRLEQRLQGMGYRGLILDSRLVKALACAAAAK